MAYIRKPDSTVKPRINPEMSSYSQRALSLRQAVKYSRNHMARLLQMGFEDYLKLERRNSRYIPTLNVIRRLRLLEEGFKEELEEYYKLANKFHTRRTWSKETVVFERFGGYKSQKVERGFRCSFKVPRDKRIIEALGGIEMFGRLRKGDD